MLFRQRYKYAGSSLVLFIQFPFAAQALFFRHGYAGNFKY